MPVKSATAFASVTISFFIHSTEDEVRLIQNVSKALGISKDSIVLDNLQGHHGNTLRSAKAHIIGNEANRISKYILGTLDVPSKSTVVSELEKSVDEHDALYLRLDRQLVSQKLALSAEEPIRVKLKPRNRFENRRAIKDAYLELLKS